MKLYHIMVLLLLTVMAGALLVIANSQQVMASPIEGQCTYEGAECPNAQHYLRDYQLEYHNDTLWIYDADRLVGTHIDTSLDGINHGLFIDSTILKDSL